MNKAVFKLEVSEAVKQIAQKHGVTVKIEPVAKVQDHMEAKIVIIEKSNTTRTDQVKALYKKGLTSAKIIAERIGSHPSYVGLLLTRVKKVNEGKILA